MAERIGRSYIDLLKEPDDMTEYEKVRLKNIKNTPARVRKLVVFELARLQLVKANMVKSGSERYIDTKCDIYDSIDTIDRVIDELINFLEGEWEW